MIVSFLLILYTLFTAYISGIVFLHVFSKILGLQNTQNDFAFTAISGIFWLAFIISIQHIFYKIGLFSHLFIWAINAIVWALNSKAFLAQISATIQMIKNKPKSVYYIYFLFLFGALINIVARPALGDAADYHFQAIRWMEEYKVTPGIGNIRRQLGNNSNWFLLNAFFGFSFAGLKSVYVLNASLLMIACSYFAEAVTNKLDKLFIIKTIVLVYLLTGIFRKYVGAVTNDYVITVMVLYIFTLLLETDVKNIFVRMVLVFFIVMMITFKLSALPMLILGVFIIWGILKQLQLKQFFVFTIFILSVFTTWIYTNMMHSGYLVFPISAIDIFDVDWKMRKSVLEWEVMANLAWARVPFTNVEISSTYNFATWFPLWIKSLDGFSIFLLLTSISLTAFFSFIFLIKSIRIKITSSVNMEYLYIFITILIALYLWFTHGPTPRFVFGYLVFMLAVYTHQLAVAYPVFRKQVNHYSKHFLIIISFIFCLSGIPFLPKYFTINSFVQNLILPQNYTQVKTNRVQLQTGYVNVPDANNQCWDSPLPCTSNLDTALVWRGTEMEQGFKIKQ